MVLIGQSAQKESGTNVANCRQRCFGVTALHQCSAAQKTRDVQKYNLPALKLLLAKPKSITYYNEY
ncbi:hypothetical protein NQ317_005175 [Molorchus minor]|uniref:Uncharacterized protein n=1 Tax=Molorchus minor TaxID=1323400 RepID=A0ABQ9JCU8_9CUCU|nr:hypothetical protein NQ317_005175 [Molorchus minor]